MSEASVFTTRLEGPSPEVHVSTDMIKRGLVVAPLLIAVCAVIWGGDGAWSAAYGIGLVLANFAIAAAIISMAARISLGLLMGATLFGYLIRLGLIFLAVYLVKDAGLDFAARPRSDHHRDAPRAAVLGDEVRGDLPRPPRPEARPPDSTSHTST